MSFSYKRIKKKKLKYNINVLPFVIDPAEAKALEKKLVHPSQRAGNFKRAMRKTAKKERQ